MVVPDHPEGDRPADATPAAFQGVVGGAPRIVRATGGAAGTISTCGVRDSGSSA
jgi:hypothetical protein